MIAKENGDDPDFGFAFCHLHSWDVTKGQQLKRGDVIGTEGNRGQLRHGHTPALRDLQARRPRRGLPLPGLNLDPEPILKEKGAWPK